MKDYINASLKDYLDDLAAKQDAPGGGSASGLVAALSAALGSMVCQFTIGKKKYAQVEGRIKELLGNLESSRSELAGLMQKDIDVFHNKMGAAFSLPKETDQQKQHRKEAIEEACKATCQPPLETAHNCLGLLKIFRELAEIGNVQLVSDVGVAAVLSSGAFEGAKLNVEINLKYISDGDFVKKVGNEINAIDAEVKSISEQTLATVRNKLMGK